MELSQLFKKLIRIYFFSVSNQCMKIVELCFYQTSESVKEMYDTAALRKYNFSNYVPSKNYERQQFPSWTESCNYCSHKNISVWKFNISNNLLSNLKSFPRRGRWITSRRGDGYFKFRPCKGQNWNGSEISEI